MLDTRGKFYLGRILEANKPLLYDPADLTTHAVVVGMTGSGKTGLCMTLLEEAALQGVPALMIDPKGDITNALLHFPDLSPADFRPWVDAEAARRSGKSPEQMAAEVAETWREGLRRWGIGTERLRALQQAAHFAVFTPGSDAGLPISILSGLRAPEIPWEENKEFLRERIAGTVTALLGLVGMKNIDPVRSREHILLANLFEHAWSRGQDLDLGELILQIQNPPFEKLGVFAVETFFPQKERFELAMQLNNMLAAPGFQAWMEGQPLDIPGLLYAEDGRPRHSVFYIAHLNEAERMFFVTLLYSAVAAWMRSQSGSAALRAILYFDEIYGYIPPVANPPAKGVMLRMLKQGRAFGVGQVLVTQNPGDLDYKALSNAGSWFIGKLQSENDRERVLDGLQGAGSGFDRQTYDRLLTSLDRRVFLLHNVHADGPVLFESRWAMNYLAGPLPRAQLRRLNRLAGVEPVGQHLPAAPAAESTPRLLIGSQTRPAVPIGVDEFFLPNNLTLTEAARRSEITLPADARPAGLLYRPVLLAQATARLVQRKYNLDYSLRRAALVTKLTGRASVRWENFQVSPLQADDFDPAPAPQARFGALEPPLSESKTLRTLKADFLDWVYRTIEVKVRINPRLKVHCGPEISQAEFRRLCSEVARQQRAEEVAKVEARFERKLQTLEDRLLREQRELEQDREELAQRKLEEYGTHAENLLALLGRSRRRLSTSLTKRRLTEQARQEVEESLAAIADYQRQIEEVEAQRQAALQHVQQKWADIADDMQEVAVRPYKKDILPDFFGVAWMPYYLVEVGDQVLELPGYGDE